MPSSRTMRADARENYDALVTVAREHLSKKGVATSLEAIAREAGVGVGTLYRHFPDRDELICAALSEHADELRSAPERIRATAPKQAHLELWLLEVENYFSSYQGFPDSIAQALDGDAESTLVVTCREIIDVTGNFLADAQQQGVARADVTGQDLFEAVLMSAWLASRTKGRDEEPTGVRNILRHGYQT